MQVIENESLLWDDVRYFLALARSGSLNRAARDLGVDQTTVGRHLRALEDRVGFPLFVQQRGSLSLTRIGERALQQAEMVETAVDAFQRKVKNRETGPAGKIRLGVTEGLTTFWLVPRLQPFLALHPRLEIEIHADPMARDELSRDLSMALRWERPAPKLAAARKLATVPYHLFTTKSYVEEFGMPESIARISGRHLLHFKSYEQNPGLAHWNELVKAKSPAMTIENAVLGGSVLPAGNFIALLPNYALQVEPNLVRLPFDLGLSLSLWLAYHEDLVENPKVQMLADEIKHLFQENRGVWLH